jgi:adenosylcobinamide-phosphate synthase
MHTDVETAWGILGLALLMDVVVGEYPAFLHPVVWMGKLTSASFCLAPASGWWRQLFFGTFATLMIVGLSASLTWFLLRIVSAYPPVEIAVAAFLLKASFALRELGQAATRVVQPLEEGSLADARKALLSLCSRDPSALTEEELLAATIESLAENASDSFIAPLLFYVLLGVPGALAYRAINTLDAMIGYRGKYEAMGKFAARLDDVANWIPARLAALLFLSVGWLLGGNVGCGWRILRRDAAKTPSPNGGRPMAAMAGLLCVQLSKKDVYSLGDADELLTAAKVRQAWRIVVAACGVMAVLAFIGLACFHPWILARFSYN